jgi:hypothetical protein
MKEILIPFLRASQLGIITLISLSFVLQTHWQIELLLLIVLGWLVVRLKANLFVILAKPFLKIWAAKSGTEARELTRFYNTQAVISLCLSIGLLTGGHVLAGLFIADIQASVASIAICGFCLD